MLNNQNFHFYARLLNELSKALTFYVSDTAAAMINAIFNVTYTLLLIYTMFWGWAMIRGAIQEPVLDGFGRIIRLTVIVAVALNLGIYNGYLGDWLFKSPDALAAALAGPNAQSSGDFLDTVFSKIFDFGLLYWNYAFTHTSYGFPALGHACFALAIFAVGIFATGYGAFLFALSKISLAVILGIGPIFVLALIFEPTKKFFDAWLGQALTFVFLVLIAAATIKLILNVLQLYLGDMKGHGGDPGLDQAIPVIVICLIAGLVLVQAPAKAAALAGGFAISSLGIVAYLGAKLAGSTVKPVTNAAGRLVGKGVSKAYTASKAAILRKVQGLGRNTVGKA